MTYFLNKISSGGLVGLLMSLATVLTLAACGGGGGSPGTTVGAGSASTPPTPTTPVVPPAPTILLELVDSTGAAKTSITTSSPLTARATVKDAAGKPIANTIVGFAVGPDLTVIAPAAGTAMTNAAGVATVNLSIKNLTVAQTQSGAADTVSATVTVGDQALLAKAIYSLGTSAITLRLAAPNPATIRLNAYDTTPVKVDVLADGVLYTAQPVTVNFSSSCANSRADMPATATTINGQAQVTYRDKGCGTTDVVTASVAGAQPVTATLVIAPPLAASIGFVSGTPSDKSIVIKGAGGTGRTETAVLTFRALDNFGQPLPNQKVNFTVQSTEPVTLQSSSAITGTDGQVIVAVSSGDKPTTFRVIATLPTGQSTISDTITVTTGQPVQAAFSVSAETYNIEGWTIDNVKTKINILIADSSGNPVADGTPVVFQTDSGAIGSSALGGCVTANGGCSVDFRSQAPRYDASNTLGKRAGMATISVSSTSGTINLADKIGVFLSGSSAVNVVAFPSGPLSTASCGNFSLALQINDVNFNPMPSGTTIAAINTDKVTVGTIIPSVVPSVGPRTASGFATIDPMAMAPRQGSVHFIPVKPDATACNAAGTNRGLGTFGITITSPSGIATIYNFSLSFPTL